MLRLYPDSASVTIALGIRIGSEEIYGSIGKEGNFQPGELDACPTREVLPLAGNLGLMVPCEAEIVDDDGKALAVIEIGAHEGKVACVSIQAVEGRELTGEVLRRVPLLRLVRAASSGNIVHFRNGMAVKFIGVQESVDQPRRRSLTDDFLLSVAETYRDAVVAGEPPSLAVMERLGPTTPENARRWVMAARRRGFLGPAPKAGSKGGEI